MSTVQKRNHKLQCCLSDREWDRLLEEFRLAAAGSRSSFIRHKLLSQPVVWMVRNQSMDNSLEELILLKKEIERMNFLMEQAIARLQQLDHLSALKPEIAGFTQLLDRCREQLDAVQRIMIQMHDQWLQKSTSPPTWQEPFGTMNKK